MSILSIVMLVASVLFLYFVFRNINQNNILFEQAFMWIIIGFVLIVISIFDWIPVSIAKLLGFELTSNFVMSLDIFILLVFLHTISISKQKEQIKQLVQELSIMKQRMSKLESEKDEK